MDGFGGCMIWIEWWMDELMVWMDGQMDGLNKGRRDGLMNKSTDQ